MPTRFLLDRRARQGQGQTVADHCILAYVTFAAGCGSGDQVATAPREPTAIEVARGKAVEALAFCRDRGMSEEVCLLVDMGVHSGRKRLFVWDFARDTATESALVSHGCCDNAWGQDFSKEAPTFSNVEGSHCSSLGKYKIGERGYSSWGVHKKYLLHGLEASNSNALSRVIVFHSWNAVADEELYPMGTSEGFGCPAVSDAAFLAIDPVIRAASRPVLMWLYDGRVRE